MKEKKEKKMKKRQFNKNLMSSIERVHAADALEWIIANTTYIGEEGHGVWKPINISSEFNLKCINIKQCLKECKRTYGHKARDLLKNSIKASLIKENKYGND